MIMIPAQNYSFPLTFRETIHGGCHYYDFGNSKFLESDSLEVGLMAEGEAGPSYCKSKPREEDDDNEEREEERDGEWLQLGLGRTTMGINLDPVEQETKRRNLIELDLLSDKPAKQLAIPFYQQQQYISSAPPLILQNEAFLQKTRFGFKQPEITWSFKPIPNPWNPTTSTSNPFYSRPNFTAINSVPSSKLKLVDAPSRPQSGLWFILQAAQNQIKEPVLPQIPKNYLRIKDGKMTILLLMKYLANKLELNSESEIEITCRGQHLLPSFTLRHVRDNIWCSRDSVTLLQSSPTSEHVMILNYARSV